MHCQIPGGRRLSAGPGLLIGVSPNRAGQEFTLDIKRSKIYLDEFFSNKKHDAAEISNLNLNLNSMLAGNLKKTFSLTNFLSIY